MRRTVACLPLCLSCLVFASQVGAFEIPEVLYPEIAATAASPAGFVPPGWRLEHEARGLLDADALEDALLVLRMDDPGNIVDSTGYEPDAFDTNPRMLLVALATEDGTWKRLMPDHVLVPRPDSPSMEDFLADGAPGRVQIRPNRTWSVSLHSFASAGTWTMREMTYTFRLEDDCMRLVGFDGMDLHRASGEIMTTSVNYLTGRAWTQAGHVSDDDGPKRWTRLASSERICIEDIGHGLSFEPGLLEAGR